MVAQIYRARGEKTNRVLADAEVRRILAERSRTLENVERQLDEWVAHIGESDQSFRLKAIGCFG